MRLGAHGVVGSCRPNHEQSAEMDERDSLSSIPGLVRVRTGRGKIFFCHRATKKMFPLFRPRGDMVLRIKPITRCQPHSTHAPRACSREGDQGMNAVRNTEGMACDGDLFVLLTLAQRTANRALCSPVAHATRPNGARSVARRVGEISHTGTAQAPKNPRCAAPLSSPTHVFQVGRARKKQPPFPVLFGSPARRMGGTEGVVPPPSSAPRPARCALVATPACTPHPSCSSARPIQPRNHTPIHWRGVP